MLIRFCLSGCKTRGFTLMEVTIVLALIGLVLGAIWVTASTVLQNSSVSRAAQQVTQVVQNIRDQYANTQNPPGWTAGGDVTGTLKGLLLFPVEMTQGANVTHAMSGTFQVVEPTCGAGTPNGIKLPAGTSVCPAIPNNLVYFRIVLNGLSQTYCIKTLEAMPLADPAMGIVQAGVVNGNGCTSTSCVQACTGTPCFMAPVSVSAASGWCDGTAGDNAVFVDFKLHN